MECAVRLSTAYQMIRPKGGQHSSGKTSKASPLVQYGGSGLLLGPQAPLPSFGIPPDSDPSCVGIRRNRIGGSHALVKVKFPACLGSSLPLFRLSFEVENSGVPGRAGWLSHIS
jgi:hypothetical protein